MSATNIEGGYTSSDLERYRAAWQRLNDMTQEIRDYLWLATRKIDVQRSGAVSTVSFPGRNDWK